MLRVTFKDTVSRDAFCSRFNLIYAKVGEVQADINWHLLQAAKLDTNALDYDEISLLTAQAAGVAHSPTSQEFVVKGDPAIFGAHANVRQDLGNGFYLVNSTNGTLLGDYVDSIEHNSMGMTYLINNVGINGMNDSPVPEHDLSSNQAQWHRIRVASRYRPLVPRYVLHDVTYLSKPEVIIMDSGINFNHDQLSNPNIDKENFYALPVFNDDFTDTVGHGTALASMVCGKDLGIASYLKLVSVKIGSTTHNATLLEIGGAIDAILTRIRTNPLQTRIVNMSWGIARSAWLDNKVQALMDAGATVICAAGNNGISVEDISPAGIDSVITVAAIDKYDIPSGFNNISPSDAGITSGHGLSLDIFAPGENIVIAKNDATNSAVTLGSGTSLSAPLVSGVACIIASMRSGLTPVSELKQLVLSTSTKDALLFEDDKFSSNQNNTLYIAIADPNTQYKDSDSASYLGFFSKEGWEGSTQTIDSITIDLRNCLTSNIVQPLLPTDTFTYGVTWDDPALEAKYGSYFSIDAALGILTIARPNVVFNPDVKIDIVMFKATLSSPTLRMTSHKLFFFNLNPDLDVKKTDVTSTLTDVNSISFYTSWGLIK